MLLYFKGAPHMEHFSSEIRGNLRNSHGGENQTRDRPREKREGGKGDEWRGCEKIAKNHKKNGPRSQTPWYFYMCQFETATAGLGFVYFQVKTTKNQWPNIPEMTPFPRAILLRPNSEPRWTECTVMDIDHPEEFFEPWQFWRFSHGSITALTQLWGSDLRQGFLQQHLVRSEAPDHCCRHLRNCLARILSITPVWCESHDKRMHS